MVRSYNDIFASALYLSHGGGPLPLLGDEAHQEMVENLEYLARTIPEPSAVIVVSAHWEAPRPTLTGAEQPSLIYDYHGFPGAAYRIQYPAPGNPYLAQRIAGLFAEQGIPADIDEQRGFDHGLFVPLKILYPKANIRCLQLSLVDTLDPQEHMRIGQVLSGLSDDKILVIGSGLSFHNMKALMSNRTNEDDSLNEAFEQWLMETCTSKTFNEAERQRRLTNWASAPGARYCHPREEHLLPLHVCYGVARAPAREAFSFRVMGRMASAYLW